MSMLEFGPISFFNRRRYIISRDGTPVGEIDCAILGEKASITIGGAGYRAAREGFMSGAFFLAANDNRLVSAEKPSAFHRRFTVRSGSRTFTLSATAAFGRAYELSENEAHAGSIARQSFFSQKFSAELPDDLPLEVKAFLIWLVILLVRRQRRAAAGAAVAASAR
jgi:hypothetical protein